MTRKSFYKSLKSLTIDHGVFWNVTNDGKIRTEFKGRKCSPLTFVAYAKSGKRFNINDSVELINTELDMPKEDLVNIVLASEIDDCVVLGNAQKIRETLMRNTVEV